MEQLSSRHRRLSASPRYANPTFSTCAAASSHSNCPLGSVDASLLLYARPSRGIPVPASTPELVASTSSSSPPLPPICHRGLQFGSSRTSPYNLLPSPLSLSRPPMEVEFEEDVLVMDGELVDESQRGRSPSKFGPGSGGKSLYKTGLCVHWHENGSCHYGSKCQFAHGKSDLRRSRPSKPKKSEVGKSVGSSRLSLVGEERFWSVPSDSVAGAAVVDGERVQGVIGTGYLGGGRGGGGSSSVGGRIGEAMETETEAARVVETVERTSPEEFEWPPSVEMGSKIREVLYGPSRRKRLPVFEEICLGMIN